VFTSAIGGNLFFVKPTVWYRFKIALNACFHLNARFIKMALAPVKKCPREISTLREYIVHPMSHDVLSAGAASKQRSNSIPSWT
jgi:hypothetical protein